MTQNKQKMKDIADEITPKWRKRTEILKKLSVEELWILKKKRQHTIVIPIIFTLVMVFYQPLSFFITVLELGNSPEIAAMVMMNILFQQVFFAVGLTFGVWLAFYFAYRITKDYDRHAKKIIKRLRREDRK